MRKYLIVLGFCLVGLGVFCHMAHADKLGNYPYTKTLSNADYLPIIIAASNSNANINWSDLKNIVSSGLNWTDIKVIGTQYGDHSGLNWQAFGA